MLKEMTVSDLKLSRREHLQFTRVSGQLNLFPNLEARCLTLLSYSQGLDSCEQYHQKEVSTSRRSAFRYQESAEDNYVGE